MIPIAQNQSNSKPALHIVAGDVIETAHGGSYWGGLPLVPEGFRWPVFNDRPLDFLACLDLAQVALHQNLDWLPKAGRLMFFYDTEEQPWGFEPGDRNGWQVLFVPEGTFVEEARHPGTAFARRPMTFTPITTYPENIPDVDGTLDDEQLDSLREQTIELNFGDRPHHQIGGHPDPIQSPDMEDECELASQGVNAGSSAGYSSADGQRLLNAGGAKDWRLLLQIDTDETVEGSEWMWGDTGMLYFWVREQEAREGRFDNAWLVLQCC